MKLLLPVAMAIAALGLATSLAGGQEATSGIFAGHGRVKAVAPGTGALTIAHDDIEGFMPAMEMMYKVKDRDLSRDLRPGDAIDFKIDASSYTVIQVTRVPAAK